MTGVQTCALPICQDHEESPILDGHEKNAFVAASLDGIVDFINDRANFSSHIGAGVLDDGRRSARDPIAWTPLEGGDDGRAAYASRSRPDAYLCNRLAISVW